MLTQLRQCHVIFSGRVQGVGFRYTAKDVSRDLGLTGWVRNLADGRVEMVVEGELDPIEELLKQLEDGFIIKDKQTSFLPPSGRFSTFEITY